MAVGLGYVWASHDDGHIVRYDGVNKPVSVLSGFYTESMTFVPSSQTVWFILRNTPYVGWFNINWSIGYWAYVYTGRVLKTITYGTDGNIWCSTYIGNYIIKINPNTATVIAEYDITNVIPTQTTLTIESICVDDYGKVWCLCNINAAGYPYVVFYIIDGVTGSLIQALAFKLGSLFFNLNNSLVSAFGKIWLAFDVQVNIFSAIDYAETIVTINTYQNTPWTSIKNINKSDDLIWAAEYATGYIYSIDPVTLGVLRKIKVGKNPNIVQYGLGSVWVSSRFTGDPAPSGTLIRVFGDGYTSDTSVACDGIHILSNTLVTSNTISLATSQIPAVNTTSIVYSPLLDQFMIVGQYPGFWIGTEIQPIVTQVTASSPLQASLPVEYVFLGDEEVKLIQSAKVDYVITQIQMARDNIPAGTTNWPMRLEFINPVKEMFFVVQDHLVLQNNDYFNFRNTNTSLDQLERLEFQFNGETIISETVADSLFLRVLQFLNNHTRKPDMYVYNYSFSIDPENYLPTGQVNMSRIYNKNLYLTLTPNPNARDVRVYAKSYNILRIQNGLGGVLFMDNNFY